MSVTPSVVSPVAPVPSSVSRSRSRSVVWVIQSTASAANPPIADEADSPVEAELKPTDDGSGSGKAVSPAST